MRRITVLLICIVLCMIAFAGCDSAGSGEQSAGQLNLYTWEGMFPQEVLDGFTAETGITVNYSNFDFGETMLMKLEIAEGGDYDVVIVDDYIIEAVIAQGLAQKLDTGKIGNFKHINPIYQGQFYDPSDEYTVPYGAGVQTIMYNPAMTDVDIKGYADLWDARLADMVGIIGNFRVIDGMALKVLGESYNTNDLDIINAAGIKLLELAPNIHLIKDDDLENDLISGEVAAAVMYTSQVTLAKLADPELRIVYPTEGIGFGIMANFIPVNAPNPDAAYKFIDYILRPEVSAECFEWLGYYCTNKAAEQFISGEFKEFLTLPAGFNESMEMIQSVDMEAEELHAKLWTEFCIAAGKD